MRNNNALRAIAFIIQTKIFTSFKSLINNNLKRKLIRLTNANRFLNAIATQKNIILNYLFKKLKSNKLITLLLVLISLLIKSLINKANVSQTFIRHK